MGEQMGEKDIGNRGIGHDCALHFVCLDFFSRKVNHCSEK